MDILPVNAFQAFASELRTLCLGEFPCGNGPWRYDYSLNKKKLQSQDKLNSKFVVTLKDHSAHKEKIETLDELLNAKKSPWILDETFSAEAKDLRHVTVQTPWKVDDEFIYNYFKTMHILDKNVVDINEQFLCFKNLEELTLSANGVTGVNSLCLPPNLQVLELCANLITDLSGLILRPPPLLHLGLGLNKINYLSDYLNGEYWPSLLSLDLSHNDLVDIIEIIKKLRSLPKLRNLILQGNPLSLLPGYRGYTVDSLKDLTILDDVRITTSEKQHFKGLAGRKNLIKDEIKIILNVAYISGIPCPKEIENPDDFPEYPRIERRYFVEFLFPKDVNTLIVKTPNDDQMIPLHETQCNVTEDVEQASSENENPGRNAVTDPTSPDQMVSPGANTVTADADDNDVPATPLDQDNLTSSQRHTKQTSNTESEDVDKQVKVTLEGIKSKMLTWEMEIMVADWQEMQVRQDLISVREFLKTPMQLFIKEEKVLAYLPVEPAETPADKKTKDDKKGKDKGKAKEKDKKPKSPKASAKKDKKKKKGEEENLIRHPPEYTTLATFELSLESFLGGNFEVEQVFQHILEEATAESRPGSAEKKDRGKKSPLVKKKDAKNSAPAGKSPKDKLKDKNKVKGKNSPKGSDKGKNKKDKALDDDENAVIPPIELKVKATLHHWHTASDALYESSLNFIQS